MVVGGGSVEQCQARIMLLDHCYPCSGHVIAVSGVDIWPL